MSKISKAERRRSAAKKAVFEMTTRSTALANVGGNFAGNYVSGRFTALMKAGPFTVNQLIGAPSIISKFFRPFRQNPLLVGISTMGVTIAGTDLFQLGAKHRVEAALKKAAANAAAAAAAAGG